MAHFRELPEDEEGITCMMPQPVSLKTDRKYFESILKLKLMPSIS